MKNNIIVIISIAFGIISIGIFIWHIANQTIDLSSSVIPGQHITIHNSYPSFSDYMLLANGVMLIILGFLFRKSK